MANKRPKTENLVSLKTRTAEEKKAIASKGGKKSVEVKRKAKAWKEIANIMLSTKASDKNKELLKKYNINDEDADINSMIVYNLITQALKGDLNAIRELKEITGNKEAEKIELNTVSQVANDIGDYIGANRTTKKHD